MSTETLEEVGLPTPAESEAVKDTELNTPDGTAPDGDVETKQEELAKTFTQAEVDALIQKRLLKEERRVHRRIEQQLREQQQAQVLKEEPKRETFRDDEQYLNAQIEHLAEKRAAEKLEQRQKQAEQDRLSETFLEKAEKASEKYPDFNDVVGNPNLPINTNMAEYIAESDLGHEVAYHLGKNPSVALKIANMSPVKAALELSRIEREIAAKPQAKPSKAPEPITPVGSRGKATSSPNPSDDDDISSWMAKEWKRTNRR
jgi:hypothetical protein